MKYLLMIYSNELERAKMTEPQRMQEYNDYMGFAAENATRAIQTEGEQLHPTKTATTVRVRDGKTVTTDGPFAETHEQLGGYYLISAKDLDEAIEVASRIPAAKDGAIEVRPVVEWN